MAMLTLKPSVAALAVCTALASSYAVAYTWVGDSEDWGTGTNWTPNGTPTINDGVVINGHAAEKKDPLIAAGKNAFASAMTIDRIGSPNVAALTARGTLFVTGNVTVGENSDAELSINAAAADEGQVIIQSQLKIATGPSSTGTVTVTGSGAKLRVSDLLIVGENGTGVLNIGSPAAQQASALPGKVEAKTIVLGNSNSQLNLNHADNGGSYTLDAPLSGSGKVNVMAGMTTLTAYSPDFAGQTTLRDGGTLILNQPLAGTIQIDNGAVLGLNPIDSSDYLLTASLAGAGQIDITAGSVSLGGDNSGFTGKTTLSNSSTLIVDQLVGGAMQIDSGSTLRGGNTLSGVLTNSGKWIVDGGINVSDTAVINIGAAEGVDPGLPGQIETGLIQFVGAGGGQLNFNHIDDSGSYILSADLSGPGKIKAIAGTTRLMGNMSTFTGQTELSGTGALILNRPLGGSIHIGDGTTLSLNNVNPITYQLSASLSGTGQINIMAGTVELTADNSGFTGQTTLGGNSKLEIDQPLGGTIQINSGTTLTSGSSLLSAVVNNSGTWNATAGIDVSDTGVINIGAAEGEAPARDGQLTTPRIAFAGAEGKLNFNHVNNTSSGYTLDAQLSGPGRINVAYGTTSLTGDISAFTGKTTLSGGTLIVEQFPGQTVQIGNDATLRGASNVTGVLTNSGTWEVSNINVNDAAVINIGTAEGQATASPGKITASTIHFAGTAGQLNFNHTDSSGDYTLAANLSGSGQINAVAGTTTLSGNNADFSGQTTVSSGSSLRVSQSLGGQVIISEGAELGLAGTLSGSVDNTGSLVAMNALSGRSADPVSELNVNTLTNRGTIVLAGSTVGNTLTVTGGLVSDNGHLRINTVFNGDNSQTDKLILDGGTTSGTTYVTVNAQGGNDGNAHRVRVVETRNGATTATDAFTLNQTAPNHRRGHNRVVLGVYDYQLVRGGGSGGPDDWYLVVAGGGGGNVAAVRPEAGSYLSNQALTQALLGSTWHERRAAQQGKSGWVKVAAGHTRNQSAHGTLETKANNTRIQIGTDVLRQDNADKGSFVMGIMGGYGKVDGKTTSHSYTYTARNRVTGYNVGVYGSWYQTQDGWYVDGSLQYGQYRNEVEGDGLAKEKYDAQAWTASLETGYAIPFGQAVRGQQWFVQPHVQVAYTHYRADDHHEATGSKVSLRDKNNVLTRVGARLYARELANQGRAVQPFIEANWLHNNHHASVAMAGDVVKSDIPKNIGELKAGVEGMLTRQWTVWGDVGLQYGKHDYRDVKGLLGAKYRW